MPTRPGRPAAQPSPGGLPRWARLTLPLALALALLLGACGSAPPAATPSTQPALAPPASLASTAASADVLPLFVGRPAPGLRLQLADMEADIAYTGTPVAVPRPAKPQVPGSQVQAGPSAHRGVADAITLRWQDSWFTALRFTTEQPLDLRRFVDEGTLEFDLRADDLARSGLNVAMACGPQCNRHLNLVTTSRSWAGQGWRHVALALRCFQRDGADFSAISKPLALSSSGSGELAVANVLLRRQGQANLPCPDARTESVTPLPLEEVWALDWWQTRHQAKRDEVARRVAAGTPPRLVFIGDSITQGWEDAGRAAWDRHFAALQPLNLGFGGDRTENVLWRLQHGALDGFSARLVVLMIGTNNTGHRQEDPATTVAGIRRLLDEIRQRQPAARVLLLAVLPRGEKPDDPLRRLNNRINVLLPALADQRQVFFLDSANTLMNRNGTLSRDILPDLLHLSDAGYERWAQALLPTVQRLLDAP